MPSKVKEQYPGFEMELPLPIQGTMAPAKNEESLKLEGIDTVHVDRE